MEPDRVLETCLYVHDVEEAADWYAEVLGLDRFAQDLPRHVFFALEGQMLLLFDPDETEHPSDGDNAPPHGARGPQHAAFGVESLEPWRDTLASAGVEVVAEQDWGSGRSLYFEDPSGNVLELVERGTWPVW